MKWFRRAFILGMLVFCAFLAGQVILRARLDFQMEEAARSLETSQGRERKQQYEYDEVIAQIPLTRAELEETLPRAEEASQVVEELKAERKRLREEKKQMAQATAENGEKEEELSEQGTAENEEKQSEQVPAENGGQGT